MDLRDAHESATRRAAGYRYRDIDIDSDGICALTMRTKMCIAIGILSDSFSVPAGAAQAIQ